jgi:hypothetical protein
MFKKKLVNHQKGAQKSKTVTKYVDMEFEADSKNSNLPY